MGPFRMAFRGTSSKEEVFSKTKKMGVFRHPLRSELSLQELKKLPSEGSRQREVVSISRSKVFMGFVCCLMVELNGNHHIIFERLHHQLFVSTT